MIHQKELILCLTFLAVSADEYFFATWGNWSHSLSYWLCKWIDWQPYILVLLIVRDSEWILLAIKIDYNFDKLLKASPIDWLHILLGWELDWLRYLRLVERRLRLVGGIHRLGFRDFNLGLFNLDRHIIKSLLALDTSKDIISILILTLIYRLESCAAQFKL